MSMVALLPGVKLEWRDTRLYIGDCPIGKAEPKRYGSEQWLGTLIWPHQPFSSNDRDEVREWVYNRSLEWLRRAGLAV